LLEITKGLGIRQETLATTLCSPLSITQKFDREFVTSIKQRSALLQPSTRVPDRRETTGTRNVATPTAPPREAGTRPELEHAARPQRRGNVALQKATC